MVLKLDDAYRHMEHALYGAKPASQIVMLDMANYAGNFIYSMWSWNFALVRETGMALRGRIVITDGTWTEATLTLTKASAFANYTFADGDMIEITDGTGVTTAFYEIASRTSANAVVLKTSIGSAADGNTDIDGTMKNDSVVLPADFGELLGVEGTNAQLNGVEMVSRRDLLRMRVSGAEVSGDSYYYGAISFAGTPPVPILDIYPIPSANRSPGLTIAYRKKWTNLVTDTSVVDVPDYAESLYLDLCRAFVSGYEIPERVGTKDQQLVQVRQGETFKTAVRHDSAKQWKYGHMRGGSWHVGRRRGWDGHGFIATQVGAPN